jgi:hypothetical protein
MRRIAVPAVIAVAVLWHPALAHGPASAGLARRAGSALTPAGQSPFESATAPSPRNRIDELVFARLKQLGIEPAPLCSDAVFLRRAYLDVIGTLPTVDEARAFLEDRDPARRARLVDQLLGRDEFADYWAMRWSDVLRVKSEFPINLWPNAVQAYHRWIRTSLADSMPYDRFARALLTGSGSNFRVPPVNFYRAVQSREPRALAAAVALTCMGARVDRWPADRRARMAAFFSAIGYKSTTEWKEEIVFFDPDKLAAGSPAGAPRALTLPDGSPVRLSPGDDPREAFATWLLAPGNPWFARNAANRIWFWLLGRGIVHEPDDIRPDNPPANPELLAFLERELVAARYDAKHVYRLILNSATYQLSAAPGADRPEAEANFAHALLRPLDAEVLVDALDRITGTGEQYASPIPEPYTFIPPDRRSIALADGSITSTFLETFGRPPRDTGLLAERGNRPTAAQRLYLLNSSDVQRRIQQGPALQALVQASRSPRDVVTSLYLAILSRFPTEGEMKVALEGLQAGGAARRAAAQDLAWALINSAEFRYRH